MSGDVYYPDPNYRIYSESRKLVAKVLQVSVEDAIRDTTAELASEQQKIKEVQNELSEANRNFSDANRRQMAINENLNKLKTGMDSVMHRKMDLERQDEVMPPDVSQLEEDLNGKRLELDNIDKLVESKKTEREQCQLEEIEAGQQVEQLENDRLEKTKVMQEAMLTLETKDQNTQNFTKKVRDCSNKVQEEEHKNTNLWKDHQKAAEELATHTDKVMKELKSTDKCTDRVVSRRPIVEIDRQFSSLQKQLQKETEIRGDPVQVELEYKKANLRYETVKKEIDGFECFISKIQTSLDIRTRAQELIKMYMAVRLKAIFKNTMATRNMLGYLTFDFENESLVMRVSKNGNAGDETAMNIDKVQRTSQNRQLTKKHQTNMGEQSLQMMSGGERSFATMALITSLWEEMECPIRMLDEFDVFMDRVARRQSIDFMITMAMKKAKSQYIFLTPLETQSVRDTYPQVHIYIMTEPERGLTQQSQNNRQDDESD